MKLKRYRVYNFRSIEDSDWVDCDDVTTLVGVNESGKSNMLLALWKLNPVREGKIDILHDMPVDKLSEYRGIPEKIKFITSEFILESTEVELIANKYDFEVKDSNIIELTRFYDGKYRMLLNGVNTAEYVLLENEIGEEGKETKSDNQVKKENKLFHDLFRKIPKFVYYSNYGNLSSKIYLPYAVKWLDGETVTGIERNEEQIRTLRILFEYVDLSPEEILELGKDAIDLANSNNSSYRNQPNKDQIEKSEKSKEERSILLQSASNRLTKSFRDWWKQGDYRFRFEADGDYFTILVSDEKRSAEVDLGLRSTGLQWFLSFYLTFLVESEEAHENAILLLDEAGLTLHPLAQKDLVNFFNNLAKKNQLINTTHSPFIVDTDNMDRCKVVYVDEDGLTKVSNDLRRNVKNDLSSVYAVHAALGLSVSDVLLQGCQAVVVEGVSDQHYLNAIKNYLISTKKINPNKEIVFVPSGGIKNIASISSLIGGKNSDIPFIIIDSDKSGSDLKKKLLASLYKDDRKKIIEIKDYTDIEYSEVEDLFPFSLLDKPLLRLLRDSEDNFEDEYDSSKPLINQVEEFAKKNDITLEDGWKVELSKNVKKQMQKSSLTIEDDATKKWIKLFKAFITK